MAFAKVRGSNHETYEQEIELYSDGDDVIIEGFCSCPVGYNCKHVAAVLIEIFESRLSRAAPKGTVTVAPPRRSGLTPVIRSHTATPAPSLSKALDTWLNRAHRGAAKSGFSTNHRLLFMLSLVWDGDKREVRLEIYSGKLNKDGSYHDVSPYSGDLVGSNRAQFVRQDDDIIRMLTVSSGYGYSTKLMRLTDTDLSQYLLRRLLATGRLFWGGQSRAPLQLGTPRSAALAWQVQPDGVQQTTLQVQPEAEAILPLTPPWYVDTLRGWMGVIETTATLEEVQLFLACPPVPAVELPQFQKAFKSLPEDFPRPQPLTIRRTSPQLIPRLTLSAITLPGWYGGSGESVDAAALEYRYGEVILPASDTVTTPSHYRDGHLTIMARDPKAERRARQVIEGYELVAVSHFHPYLPKSLHHHFVPLANQSHRVATWQNFVLKAVSQLRQSGWEIVFDDSFSQQVVEPEDWYGELEASEEGWFSLELGVVIGGERVSLIPLLIELIARLPGAFSSEALANLSDDETILVPYGGKQLAIPAARVKAILATLVELYLRGNLTDDKLRLPLLDAARLLELEEALELRCLGADELRQLAERLRNFEQIALVNPAAGLQATLRPYQQQGLSWLQFLRDYQLAGVLADDMGLGKTLQTLAHLQLEKAAGRADAPSLVVCPTSVAPNWVREAERFTPELRVLLLHGKERKEHFETLADYDLIVTTYPLIARDFDALKDQPFYHLILDEAQVVKNPKTNAFKAVAALTAEHRLALSGTPLENHLGELWALFHFLMPGFLGSSEQFRRLYRTPIERQGDSERQQQLVKRVKPFILRRTKQVVAKELPEKNEITVPIELSDGQRDLYETLRVAMHKRVRDEIDKKGLARSQIMVLDAILKLRQVCCDPRLVNVSGAKKVKTSAKLEWLLETLPEMLSEGRKVLLFSQFAKLLELVEVSLQKLSINYAKLTGQTKDREAQIRAFQEGDAQVFLITLKAGGVGLNLTAADTVIHFDPWWNPAAENQATDRAYRIGQDKPVFVYKLISTGSIEEKILRLQERKAALAAGILSGSLSQAVALTQDDVQMLFAPLEAS